LDTRNGRTRHLQQLQTGRKGRWSDSRLTSSGGWGIPGNGAPWETAAAAVQSTLVQTCGLMSPRRPMKQCGTTTSRSWSPLWNDKLGPTQRIFVEYGNECFFGNNQCYRKWGSAIRFRARAYDERRVPLLPSPFLQRTTCRRLTIPCSTEMIPTGLTTVFRHRLTRVTSDSGNAH